MKGSQESLTTAVVKDAANWSTPESHPRTHTPRNVGAGTYRGKEPLANQVAEVHGQADPASSSSLGSRQGWWTPQVQDSKHSGTNPSSNGDRMLLVNQVCWGTPTARDHKSGRGNEDRQYKELTPMVERVSTGKLNSQWVTQLMGLNLGWVSPSCPVSVIKNWPRFVSGWCALTIAPTSCDSSAMELCLPPQSELSEFSLAS
jgi:hypothetical protein